MGHIENLAWVARLDVQKPAQVLWNPKRMMILAIDRDNETWLCSTILLQEVYYPNMEWEGRVIEKAPKLVSELNFFLPLSERLDNFFSSCMILVQQDCQMIRVNCFFTNIHHPNRCFVPVLYQELRDDRGCQKLSEDQLSSPCLPALYPFKKLCHQSTSSIS